MKIFFSEVIKLFKRSFSALKTVNTYLALTASDNRINHLMILHVHNKKTDNLNISKIANKFVERNKARKHIFGQFKQDETKILKIQLYTTKNDIYIYVTLS